MLDKPVIQAYNALYKRIIKGENFMCKIIKNLGEAKLEIMQVIWASSCPVTSNYILNKLKGHRKWQLSTLMTSLSRLSGKGFIDCNRETGTNLYYPIITENDYKTKESRNFLKKLYNNSIQNLVANLYSNKVIKDNDIEELKKYLDKLEEGK